MEKNKKPANFLPKTKHFKGHNFPTKNNVLKYHQIRNLENILYNINITPFFQ